VGKAIMKLVKKQLWYQRWNYYCDFVSAVGGALFLFHATTQNNREAARRFSYFRVSLRLGYKSLCLCV